MEDSKIVDLYWARSENAITETKRKYDRYCFSIASNILPFHEDAEECVNDTYLAAWNSIPPSRPSILSTYLGKLTRRISIDRWRKLSADKRGHGPITVALDELAECIPSESNPAEAVEAKALAEVIGRFLDTVPYTERKVFLMRYFDMAKIQDIARGCNMSPSKVKSMLHRTRCKLRIALQKEGY